MMFIDEQISDEYDDTLEDMSAPEEEAASSLPRYTSRSLFQAHAALLDNPVVSLQPDPDTYRLVRTHIALLESWHEHHTGWRIQRGPSFFRLERHIHTVMPVYLDEKLKKARDIACLAWVLWFAEKRHLAGGGRDQQFLLSQLIKELEEQSQYSGGTPLDFRNQQDRYSIWHALDYLTSLGGLQALEGEVRKWVEDTEQASGEVLYEFTPIAHSLVEALNTRRVAAITAQLGNGAQSSLTKDFSPLVRAWRTLLLGPALFRRNDPEAFRAIATHVEEVNEELVDSFGWSLELNNDYACIVRGGSSFSSGAGPALSLNRAIDQIILLLCSTFRQQIEQQQWLPDAYGCVQVQHWDILPLLNDLRQRYSSYWGATIQQEKATELLEKIYQRMRLLGLLSGPDADGNILILPTVARYNVSYGQEQQEESPSRTRPQKQPKQTQKKKTGVAKSTAQIPLDWINLNTS